METSPAVLFIGGLVLLCGGAELVVRGASRLAVALSVRPLVLGLTIVAIGTSIPELAVGITASLQGNGSLAVGNIAGTNLVNILFILGLSAWIKPLPIHLQILKLELPMMVAAAIMLMYLAWDGVLTRLDGGVLVCASIFYTLVLILMSRRESRTVKKEFKEKYGADGAWQEATQTATINLVLLVGGLVLSILGADWLVTGAVDITRTMGVSDAFIGLTIVAIGTSSPEIATTIVATIKNERDIAVGNLVGSSIYNLLFILGATCMVPSGGVPVERQLILFDLPLVSVVALVCVPVFLTDRCVSRLEGAMFVVAYVLYLLSLIFFRS